jgi:cytochrome c biogenesis protein CcdA
VIRRLAAAFALVAAAVLSGPRADARQIPPSPAVAPPRLTPLVESGVHAGGIVRLALQVEVPPGLHVQSNTPRDPSLKALTLALDVPADAVILETVFPAPSDYRLEGSTDLLSVFEGQFAVGVRLKLSAAQPVGDLVVEGRLRYQACDDKVCFVPKTATVAWTVPVLPRSKALARRNTSVFDAIRFGTGSTPSVVPASPAPVTAANPTDATPPVASPGDPAAVLATLERFNVRSSNGGFIATADFLKWIKDSEAGVKDTGWFEGRGPLAILAIVFIGGLALNLTPCVLPMIPINLAIIGAGTQAGRRSRGLLLGATYGAAMALVYGVLGLVVILTAGSFGAINASPWFNVAIAVLFVFLGLAMFDIVTVDFSRFSSGIRFSESSRGTFFLAFAMGAIAALLAGACVAPVVIQVVLFASNLYARGTTIALALPFLLGVGMAIPWPIAGAGLAALPKPGKWMVRVKYVFGVFILGTAVYYGYLAYELFANRWVDPTSVSASVQEKLREGWHASLTEGLAVAERDRKPVFIDLWATWCKNCLVMDRTTLADPQVKSALDKYVRVKQQAEDYEVSPVKELMSRARVVGLPAYVILEPK